MTATAAAAPASGAGRPQLDQDEPSAPAPRQLGPLEVFRLADQARTEGRTEDAIIYYEALEQDEDRDVRAEARFRKGMMLADIGRYADAALAFRALLDEQPGADRVRIELARVLALMGDEGAARRELRQAQAGGLPADVALQVGQFDQALRSRKPLGGSLEVSLAPDSNPNRATRARQVDTIIAPLTLSDDARQRSGIGLHAAAQAYLKAELDPGVSLVPRVTAIGDFYRDSAFEDVSLAAAVGLELQEQRDRVTPSLTVSHRWYGRQPYALTAGVSLGWIHALGRRAQLVVNASGSWADFRRNDLQDGTIYGLSASLERALSARAGVNVALDFNRQDSRDAGYSTGSGGLSILGWREAGRTTFYGSVGVRRLHGDEPLFLFGRSRSEWLYTARLGGTFRQLTFHNLAPYVRITFERNSSNIGLYTYNRLAGEFGLSRAF